MLLAPEEKQRLHIINWGSAKFYDDDVPYEFEPWETA
jgi:hypothetical protein